MVRVRKIICVSMVTIILVMTPSVETVFAFNQHCTNSGMEGRGETGILADKSNFTSEFLKASPNTIVCYIDGVEIKKSDVSEAGLIVLEDYDNEVVNESVYLARTTGRQYYYPNDVGQAVNSSNISYLVLNSTYKSAIIKTSISVPRYSQQNTKMYLSAKEGAQFASSLEYSTNKNLIVFMLGFIPKIGPALSIPFSLNSLYKSSVASEIRKYTDNGKKVVVKVATSNYGTFYGVKEWTGNICPMVETEGSETLTNVLIYK